MKLRIEPLFAIHHYGNRNDQDEASRTAASLLTPEQKAKMPLDHPPARAQAPGDRAQGALRGVRQLVRHRRHVRGRSR